MTAVQRTGARLRGLSRRQQIAVGSWLVAVLMVIVLAAMFGFSGGSSGSSPTPPQAAHTFSLPALGHSGAQVSLSQYAGRPVVVNFFASWCGPCQKETPTLAQYYKTHGGTVAVVGVDVNDGSGAALGFMRKSGVSYPVGFDPSVRVAGSYGVIALPQTFFLNAAHKIVKRVYGPVTDTTLNTGVALSR